MKQQIEKTVDIIQLMTNKVVAITNNVNQNALTQQQIVLISSNIDSLYQLLGGVFVVSGATNPEQVNGTYVNISEGVYKHVNNKYFIYKLESDKWSIASELGASDTNDSSVIFYTPDDNPDKFPWEIDNWDTNGSNYSGEIEISSNLNDNTGDNTGDDEVVEDEVEDGDEVQYKVKFTIEREDEETDDFTGDYYQLRSWSEFSEEYWVQITYAEYKKVDSDVTASYQNYNGDIYVKNNNSGIGFPNAFVDNMKVDDYAHSGDMEYKLTIVS